MNWNNLRTGDLIFVRSFGNCSTFIRIVAHEAELSHVGLIYEHEGNKYIFHMRNARLRLEPLDRWISFSRFSNEGMEQIAFARPVISGYREMEIRERIGAAIASILFHEKNASVKVKEGAAKRLKRRVVSNWILRGLEIPGSNAMELRDLDEACIEAASQGSWEQNGWSCPWNNVVCSAIVSHILRQSGLIAVDPRDWPVVPAPGFFLPKDQRYWIAEKNGMGMPTEGQALYQNQIRRI